MTEATDEEEPGGLFCGLFTSDVQIETQSFEFAQSAAPPLRVSVQCVHHENQYLEEFVSRSVWPSAVAVCALIARDPRQFLAALGLEPEASAPYRLSACELGSGTGLCGLTLAQYLERTVLTDGEDRSVQVLRASVGLNRFDAGQQVRVERLRWGAGEREDLQAVANGESGGFDLVLGTDVVYREWLIRPMLETAAKLLSPTGRFYLANHKARIGQLQAKVSSAAEDVGLIEERWPNIEEEDGDAEKPPIFISVFRLADD